MYTYSCAFAAGLLLRRQNLPVGRCGQQQCSVCYRVDRCHQRRHDPGCCKSLSGLFEFQLVQSVHRCLNGVLLCKAAHSRCKQQMHSVIDTSSFLQFLDDFMPTIHQQTVEISLNFLKDKDYLSRFCWNMCCAPGV